MLDLAAMALYRVYRPLEDMAPELSSGVVWLDHKSCASGGFFPARSNKDGSGRQEGE
jgi:hypothetical protein